LPVDVQMPVVHHRGHRQEHTLCRLHGRAGAERREQTHGVVRGNEKSRRQPFESAERVGEVKVNQRTTMEQSCAGNDNPEHPRHGADHHQ
jgi:hypothetical protein